MVGKVFKIVCADGTEADVRFFSTDFKHLTGLYSDLNDTDFYRNCISGTIDIGNIDTNQKYDWNTLKKKATRIEKIHELLYKDGQKTLLLEALDTNTYVFPIAIKNIESNICVGFVSNINKARSLRTASNSTKAISEKKIIAIFSKPDNGQRYNELVYLTNVRDVYCKNERLLEELEDSIQMRFLEIITRP